MFRKLKSVVVFLKIIVSFVLTRPFGNSQITLHIICINFQVVFFENNFRAFATLNAVCEETIKLHIFIESRQEIFKKELIYKRRCGSLCRRQTKPPGIS